MLLSYSEMGLVIIFIVPNIKNENRNRKTCISYIYIYIDTPKCDLQICDKRPVYSDISRRHHHTWPYIVAISSKTSWLIMTWEIQITIHFHQTCLLCSQKQILSNLDKAPSVELLCEHLAVIRSRDRLRSVFNILIGSHRTN